jgi:hypothetical protein
MFVIFGFFSFLVHGLHFSAVIDLAAGGCDNTGAWATAPFDTSLPELIRLGGAPGEVASCPSNSLLRGFILSDAHCAGGITLVLRCEFPSFLQNLDVQARASTAIVEADCDKSTTWTGLEYLDRITAWKGVQKCPSLAMQGFGLGSCISDAGDHLFVKLNCLNSDVLPPVSSKKLVNGICSKSSGVSTSGFISYAQHHIGCFKDTARRDLATHLGTSADMTPARCFQLAVNKGFKFFSLQVGRECFGGDAYGKYGKSTGCNHNCVQDGQNSCGGPWANDVCVFKFVIGIDFSVLIVSFFPFHSPSFGFISMDPARKYCIHYFVFLFLLSFSSCMICLYCLFVLPLFFRWCLFPVLYHSPSPLYVSSIISGFFGATSRPCTNRSTAYANADKGWTCNVPNRLDSVRCHSRSVRFVPNQNSSRFPGLRLVVSGHC